MTEAQIAEKMVVRSRGNAHDTAHFMRVWAWARTVGMLEGLDEKTQFILEAASIVHDIACPLCREKYGSADGKLQEKESPPLVKEFFSGTDVPDEYVERISFLAAHHHTCDGIDGADYAILLEADFLVNAADGGYGPQSVRRFHDRVARTASEKRLIREAFRLEESPAL